MSTLATKHVAAVLVGVGLVLSVFAFATPANAVTIEELQAQIQALLAQIASLQGGTSGGAGTGFTFTRNHSMGDSGGEVMQIQKFLNSMADTKVSDSGAGSPGNESSYFGAKTKAAVAKFQNKYAADILAPVGLSAGTGYWGASTRAKANALNASGTGTGTGTTPPVTGTPGTLFVAAAAQPANNIAPEGASQIGYTNFALTNNGTSAVTVDTVTVERTGYGADAVFAGIIVVDGIQRLGNVKTLNSNHQAVLTVGVTLQPGQSKTLTIAGDMAVGSSALDNYAGQLISLSVVGVNTSAAVSGSLPITGATHTINSTLSIGSLAMTQGVSDPDASATKEIGTTAYVFGSVRATAGSAEDVWVKSIRWNQAGSAGVADLANIKVRAGGTDYDTAVSADGKYYTATFPGNGLEIQKGNQLEFEVRGDIVGGTNRTVRFDLYRANDIYAVGEVYSYGMTPTQSESGTAANATSEFTSGTPFFDGSQVTISAGTVNSVSRANEVPAQNIAENAPNQPLGGFVVDIKGESITVAQSDFRITVTGSGGTPADITSVTLVDENGAVVAGPVDAADTYGTINGRVRFTDTVTYPAGRHVYTLKGKIGTDFTNSQTVVASTTPSTDWTTVRGLQTGDTVSLSTLSTMISGNTMTVRTGAVTLSVNPTPAAKNVVAGAVGILLGQYNFDATQSGEDVRFTSAKFYYDVVSALTTGTAPTNCFAYDGATRLNNTAVNPSGVATGDDADKTYTLDNILVVPKGTVKTIAVKCDLPGSASAGSFAWDLNTSSGNATFDGTGVNSGQTITPTTPSSSITDGQTMTVATAGALTISKDSSSPAYYIAAGGSTNVTLGVLRFNGTNEDQKLDRVALQMSNIAATSSPGDLMKVTLWDGATKVGETVFAGSSRNATTTLSSSVIIPANSFKTLTVKGDLANIGTGQAGAAGALIEVDFDFDDSTGTRSIGQSSGSTINHSTTADTDVDGVRAFRAYPTVAQLTLPSSALTNGNGKDLHRFSVVASNHGLGVALNEITIGVATSTGSDANGSTTVENFDVYAYTDSAFSVPVSGFTDGLVFDGTDSVGVSGNGQSEGTIELEFTSPLNIAAGQTIYFKVLGDITFTTGTTNHGSHFVTTKLHGDAAFPTGQATLMISETNADAHTTNDDFIWSPNSTTTQESASKPSTDWTNGYGVPGLPSAGLSGNTLSK